MNFRIKGLHIILLYAGIIIASSSSIVHFVKWRQSIPKLRLLEIVATKNKFLQENVSRVMDDFLLVDADGNETSFYDELGQSGLSAVIVISMRGCNLCRDEEIARWNELINSATQAKIICIVSEGEAISSPDKVRSSLNSAQRGGSVLPVFVDATGDLIKYFGIEASDSPVSIVVNSESKHITSANKPHPETRSHDQCFVRQFFEMLQ